MLQKLTIMVRSNSEWIILYVTALITCAWMRESDFPIIDPLLTHTSLEHVKRDLHSTFCISQPIKT